MNQIIKNNKPSTCLAPKTRLQIAVEFGMQDVRQLTAACKRHKIELPKGDIMPKHQKMIYEALGYPSSVEREWYEGV